MQYDPKQDRIKLLFKIPAGDQSACWVSRRQWLNLVHRLLNSDILPELAFSQRENSSSSKNSNEPGNEGADASSALGQDADADLNIRLIDNIGIVKTELGVRIRFLHAGNVDNIVLNLTEDELTEFLNLIEAQAGRAGWDLKAGLSRLESQSLNQKAKSSAHNKSDKSFH